MRMRRALKKMKAYKPGERRPGAIKLSSNENPRGPSPVALAAARNSLTEAHIYPDGAARDLRAAIALRHDLSENQIVIGNGSDEVMTMIAASFLDPGDKSLVATNTFSQYEFSTRLFDGEPIFIPIKDFAYDLDAFESALDASVRLVFLCTPNNPTGLSIRRCEFLAFMKRVPKETLVVVDHAYQEFVTDEAALDATELVSEYQNLIVLRTFSKIFGLAGFRVGYGIAQADLVGQIERTRLPFNTGIVSQHAALAALEDREFVDESLRINRESVARLTGLFDRLGLEAIPTQANFVTFRVGPRAANIVEACARGGVTVRHLASFGMPEWVRVTAGTPVQLDLFERVLTAALKG